MKLLRMPDKATEQFDRFVQQTLNELEIDVSRADEQAGSMQFPVPVAPAAKPGLLNRFFGGKRKYLSLLILLLFFSGAVIMVVHKNNTGAANKENNSTEKKEAGNTNTGNTNTITSSEQQLPENSKTPPAATLNTENKETSRGVTYTTPNTPLPAEKNNKEKTLPVENVKPTGSSTLVTDKDPGVLPQTGDKNITTTPVLLTDSATTKPAGIVTGKKITPPKKDTIHVIW
jgi:hypothetical protein